MTLEKDIEKELRKCMEKIDGKCLKFVSPGNNGVPDRVCIFPSGELVFTELKKPRGGRLSKIQLEQIRILLRLKQKVKLIWDYKDLIGFFKEYGDREVVNYLENKYEV